MWLNVYWAVFVWCSWFIQRIDDVHACVKVFHFSEREGETHTYTRHLSVSCIGTSCHLLWHWTTFSTTKRLLNESRSDLMQYDCNDRMADICACIVQRDIHPAVPFSWCVVSMMCTLCYTVVDEIMVDRIERNEHHLNGQPKHNCNEWYAPTRDTHPHPHVRCIVG
jgi:hypothetical protein